MKYGFVDMDGNYFPYSRVTSLYTVGDEVKAKVEGETFDRVISTHETAEERTAALHTMISNYEEGIERLKNWEVL